jgi:mannose-6-phosphate isomerase-like protein (cupin superfamily)
MGERVSLSEALGTFDEVYRPRIVATLNDYKVMVVRVKGDFVWHSHPETDDFFLVLDGQLTIQLRDRNVELGPGELFVVPRGVEHCPTSLEGAEVLLIEPQGTVNTGDAEPSVLTATEQNVP